MHWGEKLRMFMRSIKVFLDPSIQIEEVEKFFRESIPQRPEKYEFSQDEYLTIKDGYILIIDLWGRNLVIDHDEQKIIPVEREFVDAILQMKPTKINEDYKNIAIKGPLIKRGKMYGKIKYLDEQLFQKITYRQEREVIDIPLEIARDIYAHRYVYSNIYGQAPMAPISNAIRAQYITQYLNPKSEILLIGDNDMLSIILAKLGYRVTVIDVDEYVCKIIQALAKKYSVDVETYLADVRIPLKLERKYDAFITDPEHTTACLYTFTVRGLQFIKNEGLCFISWESGIMQRRIMRAMIKKLELKTIEHRKDCIYYISPISDFYEHMKKLTKKDIKFTIPKWRGDLWILQKTKTPETATKEIPISLY